MAQSLSKLFVHIIFHTKNSYVLIRNEDKARLYAYIGSVINDRGSIPILINGIKDHVHILCVMSKNISLAQLTEEIKRHSSRWIKTLDSYYSNFAWQGGYAGFSVSLSLVEKTKKYIENQEEHHKKKTFKEELILFLQEYKVEYDERYLFTD
jgi:REP element-mobilizing transposase RayT